MKTLRTPLFGASLQVGQDIARNSASGTLLPYSLVVFSQESLGKSCTHSAPIAVRSAGRVTLNPIVLWSWPSTVGCLQAKMYRPLVKSSVSEPTVAPWVFVKASTVANLEEISRLIGISSSESASRVEYVLVSVSHFPFGSTAVDSPHPCAKAVPNKARESNMFTYPD